MKSLGLPKASGPDLSAILNDFRSLDLKDPGSWPLAPRVLALIVGLLLILAAGYWFDWREQMELLDQRKHEEAKLKDDFLNKKKQAVNLDEYRKQLVEIDRSFGALLKQLPNKAEMESLLIDVNQAGLGRGLQFDLFKPGAETMKDFYAELPISVKVTGGYHDFGAFAGDVAKLARIVTLNDLAVESLPTGQLRMDAVATTYRYLDEEELAKQRRDKAAKAKSGGK
jgi:type IV pilus assembly protein PilO